MKISPFFHACVAAVFVLSGCVIVSDEDATPNAAIAAGVDGDDDRISALLEETFSSELLPFVTENAVDFPQLRVEITADIDKAGDSYGNRGAGTGAAWNFPVKGEGIVVTTKLDSRARTLDLDVDGDGSADVKLQLGPVIRGTVLRDAAPFYNFNEFRDQIEFAALSRAINNRISASIEIPEGELIGDYVTFVGVVPIKTAADAYTVTPIGIEVGR